LEGQGVYDSNDADKSADDQDVCQDSGDAQKEDGKEASVEEKNLVEVLSTTVGHFFPKFNQWLEKLTDVRNQELITYSRGVLMWAALIVILTKQGARWNIGNHMRGEEFVKNLRQLSGQKDLKTAPHGDTVEYLSRKMKPCEAEELQVAMIKSLLRGRVLERNRLMIRSKQGGGRMDKYYMVAIDGVHTHSFDYEHCSGCLVKEDERGRKTWMHFKLQASLVTENGLCLPIACEWIENEKEYKKQDCELKTFYRLIKKIREYYSQLSICVILDSLYAAGPVFEALKEARMEYMIVFKEGAMPQVWKYARWATEQLHVEKTLIEQEETIIELRCARSHEERLSRKNSNNEKRTVVKETRYGWINQLKHIDGRRRFNILSCKEVKDSEQKCNYTWLVSDGLNLCEQTVNALSRAGRCRWKIENEGNNVQKNGGYQLEHLYSRDEVSMKIWHTMLDIAHIINQLIERGSLIVAKSYGSIRDIAVRMFEHFRYRIFQKDLNPRRIQIRLCWDTS
jgi:hypothetical protein